MSELLWAIAKVAIGVIGLVVLAYSVGYQRGKSSRDD